MFFKKKNKVKFSVPYDSSCQIPVIHSSICTGEKTVGFKNINNHHFTEVICIQSEQDLDDFVAYYHLDKDLIQTEY